jgi:hypothetical protein
MTRAQGREYLIQALRPLVPSDSLDMVIEYLCSYDPFNKEEMLIFLEDVCRERNGLKAILERFIQLCHQLDSNSVVFTPKEFQGKNKEQKKMQQTNSTTVSSQQRQRVPLPAPQAPSQQVPHQQNQQTKKSPPPSHQQAISFVGEKVSQQEAKANKKQPTHRPNNRNEKGKKANNVSAKAADRHNCGCFATHHAFYTSCLSCGRIHCILEGPGDCLFCGSDLVPPLSADVANEALGYHENNEIIRGAYRQKDKLLTFDKEHAKRTQVHDAQVRTLTCLN